MTGCRAGYQSPHFSSPLLSTLGNFPKEHPVLTESCQNAECKRTDQDTATTQNKNTLKIVVQSEPTLHRKHSREAGARISEHTFYFRQLNNTLDAGRKDGMKGGWRGELALVIGVVVVVLTLHERLS